MQLLIAEILVLVVTILTGVESELSFYGAHVCLKTETYQERTQIKTLKPREETVNKRCWNVLKFFSCKQKVVVWEDHIEYVMVPRSKLVARCCDGYVEVRGTECVPHCRWRCLHGKCIAPDVCDCDPGFRGFNCEHECFQGYWGKHCALECNCVNGKCDKILGCVCHSGWMGSKCESACPDGYYGHSCENKCNCNGATCSHITGECITTTEATTSPSIAFTTATLTQFTTERDEISTSDTTQSHSILTETSVEVHNTTEWSTTTNSLSTTEIFEIFVDSETNFVHEISQTSTEATEETNALSSETVTIIETKLSEVDELEGTNIVVTKPTTEIETFGTDITTVRITREGDERETILVNNEMAQSSTIFPLRGVNEPNIEKNKTTWISLTASKEDADKNKTDNFIVEEKGNSGKETIFQFLHFLPSLSVISAASFLIVIIIARWMIVNHRRKTRMLVVVASKKGNISQQEDGVKLRAENLFWVNNCTINPVYMSDVDLNNPAPILQTFKPLDKEKEKRTAC